MSLKQRIQDDFVLAMKAKFEIGKAALSSLKAKITEAEKANGNQELTDDEVLKVITNAVKQRKQSFEAYQKAGRQDLALQEYGEMVELEKYLPDQMTIFEVEVALRPILDSIIASSTQGKKMPPNVIVGRAIGEFNKKYPGRAPADRVRKVVESMV